MKLVFATNNAHKLDEIRAILGNKIEILSLNVIDWHDEIPETADTLEGNALQKAMYITRWAVLRAYTRRDMPRIPTTTRKPT